MWQRRRVLVVDDEASIAELVADILHDEGYDTEAVNTIEAAEEMLETWRPDLLILDVILPGKREGYDLGAQVRGSEATACLPILFMSASHILSERPIKDRWTGALPKPFGVDDLLATVRRLLLENPTKSM